MVTPQQAVRFSRTATAVQGRSTSLRGACGAHRRFCGAAVCRAAGSQAPAAAPLKRVPAEAAVRGLRTPNPCRGGRESRPCATSRPARAFKGQAGLGSLLVPFIARLQVIVPGISQNLFCNKTKWV